MMRRLWLTVLLYLLEKYIGLTELRYNTNKVHEFLAESWRHDGFREYIKQRNDFLVQELAGGKGMKPLKHDEYVEYIGRRVENLHAAALAKYYFKVEEQKKRQKIKAPKTIDEPQ